MNKRGLQAVFIDRDGTIGGTNEVVYPGAFQLFPYVRRSLSSLKEVGLKIISFTNQPGISRGEVTVDEFVKELQGFGFDSIYLCPHQHGEGCICRKPEAGMLFKAAADNVLTLSKCVVVGDRWSDIVAGHRAGCITVLIKTGAGEEALGKFRNKWAEIDPDYVAVNFEDAVNWIINR